MLEIPFPTNVAFYFRLCTLLTIETRRNVDRSTGFGQRNVMRGGFATCSFYMPR